MLYKNVVYDVATAAFVDGRKFNTIYLYVLEQKL